MRKSLNSSTIFLTILLLSLAAYTAGAVYISNCKTYDTLQTKCINCNSNYGVDRTGNCTKCFTGCSDCSRNLTKCATCSDGYFALQNGNCTKCTIPNCASCTNNTKCVTCSTGYFLDQSGKCQKKDNKCVKWGSKGCLECPSQYFLNNDTGRCDECDTGCDKCYKANFCDKCSSGYSDVSQNGKCQKCSLNCLECNSKGCLTCKRDYLVDIQSGKCNTCGTYLPNCKTCKIYDYCDACSDPYFSSQGTCELCGPACSSCLSADRCTSCKDVNCKSCDPQAGCKSCNYGFFPSESDKLKKCTSCSSAIENCKDCLNKDQCLKCVDGYFDVKETGLCEKCDESCKTCESSKNQCTACNSLFQSVGSDNRCTTSKGFVFIVLIAVAVLGYFGVSYLRKQKKNAHALLDEEHSD